MFTLKTFTYITIMLYLNPADSPVRLTEKTPQSSPSQCIHVYLFSFEKRLLLVKFQFCLLSLVVCRFEVCLQKEFWASTGRPIPGQPLSGYLSPQLLLQTLLLLTQLYQITPSVLSVDMSIVYRNVVVCVCVPPPTASLPETQTDFNKTS